jgi:hypothetical protein
MKVAVCVSGNFKSSSPGDRGLPENYLERNYHNRKKQFPDADFYYATWSSNASIFFNTFPNEKGFIFDEPPTHYHPFTKEMPVTEVVKKEYHQTIHSMKYKGSQRRTSEDTDVIYEWFKHAAKQLVLHSLLLEQIKESYDIIIRTRYDAFIPDDDSVNFQPFIEKAFFENRVYGFTNANRNKSDLILDEESEKNRSLCRIYDVLIVHPRNLFDTQKTLHLFEEKKLRGGEYGWHQILSEPYGNNHKNIRGWVTVLK